MLPVIIGVIGAAVGVAGLVVAAESNSNAERSNRLTWESNQLAERSHSLQQKMFYLSILGSLCYAFWTFGYPAISNVFSEELPSYYFQDPVRGITITGLGSYEEREGRWEYQNEGITVKVENYKNNLLDGEYFEYYPLTGNVKTKGEYDNGEQAGDWYRYKENSQVAYIIENKSNSFLSKILTKKYWTSLYESMKQVVKI